MRIARSLAIENANTADGHVDLMRSHHGTDDPRGAALKGAGPLFRSAA